MGFCFSDDTQFDWDFIFKYQDNHPKSGETKKDHMQRCTRWLIEDEGHTLPEAKGFCRCIWEDHVYKKGKRPITINDINFPLQYYIDKGVPKSEIKNMMKAFFAKRKFFRKKEGGIQETQKAPSFKISENIHEQYVLGCKIIPEGMKK